MLPSIGVPGADGVPVSPPPPPPEPPEPPFDPALSIYTPSSSPVIVTPVFNGSFGVISKSDTDDPTLFPPVVDPDAGGLLKSTLVSLSTL